MRAVCTYFRGPTSRDPSLLIVWNYVSMPHDLGALGHWPLPPSPSKMMSKGSIVCSSGLVLTLLRILVCVCIRIEDVSKAYRRSISLASGVAFPGDVMLSAKVLAPANCLIEQVGAQLAMAHSEKPLVVRAYLPRQPVLSFNCHHFRVVLAGWPSLPGSCQPHPGGKL